METLEINATKSRVERGYLLLLMAILEDPNTDQGE